MSSPSDPAAFRCATCNERPRWRLDRIGDAIVTWACPEHMVLVLADFMPLDQHRNQVTVTDLANQWTP